MQLLFGSPVRRLAVLAAVVLVAAGAGWYFFIREDNPLQKEAAPVTDDVRAAAGTTATMAAGSPTVQPTGTAASAAQSPTAVPPAALTGTLASTRYRVVEGESSAWYLAPEKLASLPTTSTAKGVTKDISGQFSIGPSGLDPSAPTTFRVKLTTLRSDESRRDSRVQGALETSKFPEAVFTATGLSGLPASFGSQETVLELTGTLDLHGQQRAVTWKLQVIKDGDILSVLATTSFRYDDFGIRKPDIGGFVTVADDVTLQVQLFLVPA